MAELKLGDAVIPVATYMIRELRQAAPYIKRVHDAAPAPGTDPTTIGMEDAMNGVHNLLMVLAVGVRRSILDKKYEDEQLQFDRAADLNTQLEVIADNLEGRIDINGMSVIQDVFQQVLAEAGLEAAEVGPLVVPRAGEET
jgi:hypothetical protein